MKKFENYVTPEFSVINIAAEQGFAQSSSDEPSGYGFGIQDFSNGGEF